MQRQIVNEYPAEPQVAAMRQEAEDTIDLVEVFYLFWGHLWQIVVCLILGAVMAFSYTYFLVTPLYQATAKIYIVSASNDSVVNLSDLQIGASLTADYQELLLSRPLLQDVINNLSLNMDYKTLEGMIRITNTTDTRILKILVTSPDPQESADIANELVKQAGIYLPNIMETDSPNLVENAVAPSGKSSPSYSKNTMLGGLAGAALCCALLLVRFLMNDTFVTPDDITKYFGVQPLATIPEGDLGSFNSSGRKGTKKKTKHKKGNVK